MIEEIESTKKYVADIIGNDYEELWQPGNVIYIETQTGSGKTTFVLEKLLPLAIEREERILLLVSRKPLFEQLHHDLMKYLSANGLIYEKIIDAITIDTYQSLGKQIAAQRSCRAYDFIVADESHFFLSDATFNSETALIYDFIMEQKKAIRIFMSGTIESFKKFSCEDLAGYVSAN